VTTESTEAVSGFMGPLRRRALVIAAAAALIAAGLAWLWPVAPKPTVLHAGTPQYIVAATFTSTRIGTADVALAFAPRDPATARTEIRAVWLQAVMPTMGHTTERIPASPASDDGSGTATYRAAGLPLMMTGPWQLLVSSTHAGGTDDLSIPFWVSG
jgi:hypothetical protein